MAADLDVLMLHSPAFEAVCDAIAQRLGAERGMGHTVPATGPPYNARLEVFLAA